MVHKWLLNRHIRKQLWVEFGKTQIENYEKIKNLETEALFPNNFNQRQNHSKNFEDFSRINLKSPNIKQKSNFIFFFEKPIKYASLIKILK